MECFSLISYQYSNRALGKQWITTERNANTDYVWGGIYREVEDRRIQKQRTQAIGRLWKT